ncbi:MAG TPA: hypothetical protein VGB43_03270, partial [Flavobacterium sp.]
LSKIYTGGEFNYNNFELRTLDYNQLENQDAIILNELKDIPQALQTTLKSFVEKGGNVVIIPSSETTISNMNSMLGGFGGLQFRNLQSTQKTITKIAFSHPLYSTVFEKKIDNFQYPNVKSSFTIAGNAPAALSYEDQTAFLTSIQRPSSSVYIFTAPINKENSNFQNSPLIVPTFYNMAQNVGKAGISSITIGKNRPYIFDAAIAKDEIVNISNKDENFIPVQQILNNKVKLTFNDFPTVAGNFGIFKKNELLKNISFNYERSESDLDKSERGLFSEYKIIDSIQTVFDTLQSERTNNEIWKWFVILALIFLLAELLIQKFVR